MTRIDKWLWAARLYKTRTQAADACRSGHVRIDGLAVKPSREVRPSEVIEVRLTHLTRTVQVLGALEQRVSAAAVAAYAKDLTPPAEYTKHREPEEQPLFVRPKGSGRPTKRDRRALDELM